MNPDRGNIRLRHKEELPDLPLYVVQVIEKNPPPESTPLEWMLLTNLSVNTFDEAIEKVIPNSITNRTNKKHYKLV